MTAAGVQTSDSAAYLPPPPSTSSTPDSKGSPAADSQAAGTSGEPSDFQSELELQQTGKQQTGKQQTRKQETGKQETESAGTSKTEGKSDSGKPEKKRNTRPDDSYLSAVMPVQAADPQKQILPLALTVAQPQENATPDQSATPGEKATPDENSSEPVPQTAQVAPSSSAPAGQLTDLRQPTVLKQSVKFRQTAAALPNQLPGANVVPSATPNSSAPQALRPSRSSLPPDVSVRERATESEAPSSPDQETTSAKAPGSAENQPVSRTELNLSAAPDEPVATTPVQEKVDSAPSSPPALAFAARIAAAPQKAGQPVATNAAQIPAVPASPTPAQIPLRYAATAQIIQSAAVGTKEDEAKKETADEPGQAIRPDAHIGIRTDMVMPRVETASPASPASAPAAPQQAASSARMEPVIEPPAAPPTSNHDIRVRVPDNNGGSTQVRFVESGGEVRISVRTTDAGLAQNLRTHLNDLTQRLSDGGMPAEMWKPAASVASSQNDQHQPHQEGRGQGGQGSGGQSQQQDRQQKRPAWLEQMEASLHGEQN